MASAGSRTVTAGSEFHRPRSTLNYPNQYATTCDSESRPDVL